jgi:hypothetical protein
MPIIGWLHYAENALAPICRKLGGSYVPKDDINGSNRPGLQPLPLTFGDGASADAPAVPGRPEREKTLPDSLPIAGRLLEGGVCHPLPSDFRRLAK